ncbi:MAG: PD40 domain-containing protein [Rhodothermales bacterium]|nr:PD40 domain-containing protein [Rhodothermales bacterium]MBO6779712.1 PD40 domain-containing protein [Rhodothermales bacterium]
MRATLALLSALILAPITVPPMAVSAQVIPVYSVVYRPPGVNYLVMRSAHFDVIYQEGTEEQAREMAAVLEASIPDVSRLFPIKPDYRLSVVLNRYGDRGNGFVATVPTKSEIEGVPLFGRSLSVRHADWLMAVAPHELVHAAQGDYSAGFGVNSILKPFAPDIARALNMWIPPGIAEGAAVYVESRLEPGAGRLNHPWFVMQYRAAAGKGKPWTLAQMLENPWYTRPTDRFYKGGAILMEALADSTGDIPALRRATAFHNRFPFFGYGASFWYGTRTFPRTFGKRQRQEAIARERARQEALGTLTQSRTVAGEKGLVVRRPRWRDDNTVIAYMTAYNRRRGQVAIDMNTGRMTPVAHEELNEELEFSFSPDGKSLIAGRYISNRLAGRAADSDIFRIDLETGNSERLTRGAGLIGPTELPDGSFWAIQLDGAFSNWVHGSPESGFQPVLPPARRRFVQIEPSPDHDRAALIVNTLGVQGLYLSDAAEPALRPAVVFNGASVYDVTWSPDARWLLFSADPTDVINVFAHEVDTGRTIRLTNVAYGAFEPTLSPDGSTLAFVEFQDQRFDLKTIPFDPSGAPEAEGTDAATPAPGGFIDTTGVAALAGTYRAVDHIRPRLLYPTVYLENTPTARPGADLGTGIGLALQGVDPLAKFAYWGEGFLQDSKFWGEVGITTGVTAIRPAARLYRRPDQFVARVGQDTLRVIRDERGAELSLSLPVTLKDNIHRSTANFALFLDAQQNRLLGADDALVRDWTRNIAFTPVASFQWGLQAGLRDLVWSRGVTFVSATEFEFTEEAFGGNATASYNELGIYLPFLSRINNSIKVELASLSQTRGFVYNTDFFMPRGHEDVIPGRGTFVRATLETVQPFWFPENGSLMIPSLVRAFYIYGFAERFNSTETLDRHVSSVGGGVGVQFNFLHVLEFNLRWGKAYRTGQARDLGWVTVRR